MIQLIWATLWIFIAPQGAYFGLKHLPLASLAPSTAAASSFELLSALHRKPMRRFSTVALLDRGPKALDASRRAALARDGACGVFTCFHCLEPVLNGILPPRHPGLGGGAETRRLLNPAHQTMTTRARWLHSSLPETAPTPLPKASGYDLSLTTPCRMACIASRLR